MSWTIDSARELYSIQQWGEDYFDINEKGEVIVNLIDDSGKKTSISLAKVIEDQSERGRPVPLLLRFRNLLSRRIEALNHAFTDAMKSSGYQGEYRGVYPIKVNQQQQVIEEISEIGKTYHYGLECGSKPELLIALAHLNDPESLLVCNGYKDTEFIDLALKASQTGNQVILVVEMPGEVDAILDRAEALGISPSLGIRFRLSAKSEGHWAESGGDRSTFGLNTAQLIDAVDRLKERHALSYLKLFHYHQGSQLPNIRVIREACLEAVRVYVNLVQEGAPMGILDLGGGLAVDYDGSHTNFISSCNYGLEEYATDLVEIVQNACDQAQISHPTIVTESGRAVVAHYSVLAFNILDETAFKESELPDEPKPDNHEMLKNLWEIQNRVKTNDSNELQECFNDALFYRDRIRGLFNNGVISLRERAHGEKTYWYTITQIALQLENLEEAPDDLARLEENLISFYYANFSVFQSLPDHWAIDQLFPIMPLQRLDEEPTNQAILADITTLGDLHNLLGDPHVVSIGVEDGEVIYTNEVEGDSVADVLSYVEYEPKTLEKQFRSIAERAVQKEQITAKVRRDLMESFRATLNGYTYYENE